MANAKEKRMNHEVTAQQLLLEGQRLKQEL
jgi:hypothetical protein